MSPLKFFTVSLIVFLLAGCATVPITGRRQLSLVSSQQLVLLGCNQFEYILKEEKLSDDQEKVQMVKEVGQKIASSTESFLLSRGRLERIKDLKWEFVLLEDDDKANAFYLPGGKVGIYTGILPITKDENGLATVIAHEIAHGIANHGAERMSQELLVQLGGVTLSKALEDKPQQTRRSWLVAYGLGANVGVLLPYSRTHEHEADYIGLILMAKAGYDPRGAVKLWQRMKEESTYRQPEFLSTHPVPESRIRYIKSKIPEAMIYYKK
jgi:predicted Zn-dependent protease